MPLPRTDDYWRERVRLLAEAEGLTGPAIYKRLEAEAHEIDRSDWPGERTVGRILAEFRRLPEHEQRQYRLYRWPDAMGGDLPWEAGSACLELVRHLWPAQPVLRLVKWFWRVSLIAPDLGAGERLGLARDLAAWEIAPPTDSLARKRLSLALAFHPWRSEEDGEAYEDKIIPAGLEYRAGQWLDTAEKAHDPLLRLHVIELALGVGDEEDDDGTQT